MARDVILRTLAGTPGGHPQVDLTNFRDEPIVISLYGVAGDFQKAMARWLKSGDVFQAALKELAPEFKDEEIHRRGLISFSAGWYAGDALLNNKVERERLDAYVVLDGVHTALLNHWAAYGARAAVGDAFMVLAHSQIKPEYISTKATNSTIYQKAVESVSVTSELTPPDYVLNAELPEGGVTQQGANKKTYLKDTLVHWEQLCRLARLEYEGGTGADHLYVARNVGPRLTQWLADVWNTIELASIVPDATE
jgi:hypothetical protein